MKLDFLNVSDQELDAFVLNEFYNMTREQQSNLLKDESFIRALFSSFGFAFCHLSYLYEDDHTLLEETFSDKNIEIIKTINKNMLSDNLLLMERTPKSCEYMLTSENLRFLHNDYAFASHFLEFNDTPAQSHYDFFSKNLDNDHLSDIYKYIKLDKITSNELELLVKIKDKLGNSDKFYSTLNKDSVNKLLEQGFLHLFTKEDIRSLVEGFYLGDYSNLPPEVLKNKEFVSQVILRATNSNSPHELLKVLNMIEKDSPQVHSAYQTLFDKIVDKKENKTMEDLSFRFFKDNANNLLMNIEVILNYCDSNPEYRKNIPDNLYNVYSELLNTHNYNLNDIYNKMLNSNEDYASMLYNHMDLGRSMFSNDLTSSLTSLNEVSEVIDDVNVHIYDGEHFSFVVHATYAKNGDHEQYAEKINSKLNPKNMSKIPYLSTSYINQNNISVYSKSGIIYGFNNLKDMTMVHASCQDSYSVNKGRDSNIVTHAPTYLNIDDFSNQSTYSEILFKPTVLKPDFIVCYDQIDDYDLAVARKLGIDIVLIDSKKYINVNDEKKDKDVISKRYK